MNFRNKKFFFNFSFVFILGTFLFPHTSLAVEAIDSTKNTYNAGSSVNELQQMAGKPTNKIQIPGLNYSDIEQVDEAGDTYLYIPFLGEYLSAIYRYLVVFAGLLAVIIIIISGIQWSASGGNSGTIESAKNRIIGALTGLGLAVGSYIILYTINPELVAFRSLKIKYIVGEEIEVSTAGDPANTTGPSTAQTGTNGVPYYAQFEGPWALKKPGDNEWPVSAKFKGNNSACATIWDRGCGTTSLAMVLRFYGENVDPLTTAKWGLGCKGGFDIRGRKDALSNEWPGYKMNIIDKNANTAKTIIQLLSQNNPLVYNCAPCQGFNAPNKVSREYSGHYVVLTGISPESMNKLDGDPEQIFIMVNDPGSNTAKRINTMSLAQILKNFRVIGHVQKR